MGKVGRKVGKWPFFTKFLGLLPPQKWAKYPQNRAEAQIFLQKWAEIFCFYLEVV
nr:MAG TPA: hypothetical protein [Caudoviricetes sp.]